MTHLRARFVGRPGARFPAAGVSGNSQTLADTSPSRRRRLAVIGCLSALALTLLIVSGLALDPFLLNLVNLCLIACIGAIALNVLTGFAGLASVGTAPLLAIGAYTAAGVHPYVGFLGSLVAALLTAGLVGLLIGLPALRIGGLYLVLATLALLVIAQFGFEELQTKTNAYGGYLLPIPSVGPITFSGLRSWYVALLIFVALTVAVSRGITAGPAGRRWRTMKAHEVGAATIGISVRREKLTAFVVSSALTGVGGALTGYYIASVSYEAFGLQLALQYLAMVVVGGLGSITGAVVGAFLITSLPSIIDTVAGSVMSNGDGYFSRNSGTIDDMVYAVLVIAFLMAGKGGIVNGLKTLGALCYAAARRSVHESRRSRQGDDDLLPGQTDSTSEPPNLSSSTDPCPPSTALGSTTLVLRLNQVGVAYGRRRPALTNISFNLKEGELLVLVGPNGAGKTSLLRAIAGFEPSEGVRVTGGGIFVRSSRVGGRPPWISARAGIAFVPDRDKVFPGLTVAQHFALARPSLRATPARDQAFDMFPELKPHEHRLAGLLSGGQRQMLALGVALSTRPSALLVDEMSQGLAPGLSRNLCRRVGALASEGLAVLMVEQSIMYAQEAVRSVPDRARLGVMSRGSLLAIGDVEADDIQREVQVAYFGPGGS